MTNEEYRQAKDMIMSKEKILLLTHRKLDADWLSSMLALWIILWRFWKDVKILSSDKIPEMYAFLPQINKVTVSKDASRDFVVSIKKTNWLEIDKIRYNTDEKNLNIIITPNNWEISEENISYSKWLWDYDLIIIIDTWDLEHLWSIYQDNIEMFYNTPIINIDHHITNTGFWQINIVDSTAPSSTVIIYDLIKYFSKDWKEIIDEDIATLLMTWLITDTGSFKHNNTSPKALEIAADLMEFWAKQQEIIKNIYKTKNLSTLQIWWKALTKIKEDPIHRLVWSTVTKDDITETWADPDDTEGLIDELMSSAPWADIICLFKESLDWTMSVSLRSTSIIIDSSLISKHFWWWWHKQASWFKKQWVTNFELEVAKIIEYIQEFQKERLWIGAQDIENFLSNSSDNKAVKPSEWSSENLKIKNTWIEFPKNISIDEKQGITDSEWIEWVFELKKENNVVKKEENSNTENETKSQNNKQKTRDRRKAEKWELVYDWRNEVKKKQEEWDKVAENKWIIYPENKNENKSQDIISEQVNNDQKDENTDNQINVKDWADQTSDNQKKQIEENIEDVDLVNEDISNEDSEAVKEEEIEDVNTQNTTPVANDRPNKIQDATIIGDPIDNSNSKQNEQSWEKFQAFVNNPEATQTGQDDTNIQTEEKPPVEVLSGERVIETNNSDQVQQWANTQEQTLANKQSQPWPSPQVQTWPIQTATWPAPQVQSQPWPSPQVQTWPVQTTTWPAPQVQSQPWTNTPTQTWPIPQVQNASDISPEQQQSWAWLITKQEADKYARRFYELLQTSKPDSDEYKKYYEGYTYYARIAWWPM